MLNYLTTKHHDAAGDHTIHVSDGSQLQMASIQGTNDFHLAGDATQATNSEYQETLWYSEGTPDSHVDLGLVNGNLDLDDALVKESDSFIIG